MSFEFLLNNDSFVALNKPPGISVHDAPGPSRSLLRELKEQGEASLVPVHRLDKDASGVLLLARNAAAARELSERWSAVEKTYLALCEGVPSQPSGTIDAPILENQTGKPERLARAVQYFQREHPGTSLPPLPPPKQSAVHPAGRLSQTEYRVLEHTRAPTGLTLALLEIRPRQGRMHQIRVHLAHAGFPLAVDPLYGRRAQLLERDVRPDGDSRVLLARLSLHAHRLKLNWRGQEVVIESPLAEDIRRLLP